MFDLKIQEEKEILLIGRLDAFHTERVQKTLDQITDNLTINFKDLEYISSAGLGVLIRTFTRLKESGNTIKLNHMNNHISEVFKYSGLDKVFQIE